MTIIRNLYRWENSSQGIEWFPLADLLNENSDGKTGIYVLLFIVLDVFYYIIFKHIPLKQFTFQKYCHLRQLVNHSWEVQLRSGHLWSLSWPLFIVPATFILSNSRFTRCINYATLCEYLECASLLFRHF